jgi:16S rRNA G966 N2-methylase RsmD
MIKVLWSFGNNGRDYLFSKKIEPYKKSLHNAIVFNDFDALAKQVMGCSSFREGYDIKSRRLVLRKIIEAYRKTAVPEFLYPFLKQNERLQQLEQLERLQQLEQLEQREQLNYYNLSYEQVPIKNNSIIYCDPPYAGTSKYDGGLDHKAFFNWADDQVNPVFISEYNIPDKRFTEVWSIKKRSNISALKTLNIKIEKLYVNKAGLKVLAELQLNETNQETEGE